MVSFAVTFNDAPILGFKVMLLFKGEYDILQIIHLLNLQFSVPMTSGGPL